MDRGGALRRGVGRQQVHGDLARHLRAGADLERAQHHGLAGHRRGRLERQLARGELHVEVRGGGHLERVHLDRGGDGQRLARADLPRRHHRHAHVAPVVPHQRHHVAVPERRVVGVVHGHVHVHGEVQVLPAAAVALGEQVRYHRRRHHLGRPRPEHGEVERHEHDGQDGDRGHQHPAADQDGPPLRLGGAHRLAGEGLLAYWVWIGGWYGGRESGHM
uniref:Uncharacterized protein n=1 Tax=Zea mays TaxID=4577 RepID=A0A804MRI3_MAIZE